MNYQRGNLDFDWDGSTKISNLKLNSANFDTKFQQDLSLIDKNQGHPSSLKRAFFFSKKIEDSLNEFFEAIKEIKNKDKDDVLAAYLASYIYERLAGFWKNQLLKDGLFITGVTFWQEIISQTLEWESKNSPIKIHKGTPFFFLAHNCLLIGDRDNGFTYLYNALEDDKKLPSLNYPHDAPAYLTAIMSEKPNNYMFPQVRDLRNFLGSFLQKYNQSFPRLSIGDFDSKFLENTQLFDVAAFFVYNFKFVFDQSKNTTAQLLQNDFSRLKILDLFFNFGLIIDEVLHFSASTHNQNPNMMKEAVAWWAESQFNVTQNDFNNLIGSNGLNLKSQSLDSIMPTLLSNIQNPTQNIPKEVYIMLVTYKIRNHAGHNINQQTVLSTDYDEILEKLMFSLFFAIQSI
mgnify:CR=1 FL=1|jgi:hypothetical protein